MTLRHCVKLEAKTDEQLEALIKRPNKDVDPEYTLLQRMAEYELRRREREKLRESKPNQAS